MKNLSRRMKRLLAILLVETIVAVNVISGYASESDGVYTISEAEVEAELQESGNESAVTQEEVFDDSQDSYEESYEEQEPQQEDQNVSEGEEGASDENVDSEEQPVAEEPSLSDEENAEQIDGEPGETEEGKEETADTCTCEKACNASEYDAACPVCGAVADLDENAKEAFLKENCLKYTDQKEKQETVEPEIVNKESNITIKGISVADGTSISGSFEFEIQVADEVTLSEQAPEITGYEFTGKAYVKTKDGDVEASKLKKETIETEKKEDGVVTQIIKETKLSFYDVNGETWTELTEDTTVAFEYKKLEEAVEEDEEAIVVNFYAVCVDEDGNVIDGFEKTELTVSDSLDLTKAPVTIDGYNYVEASVDGVTATSLDKSKSTDEDGKETTIYSYITADGKVEVTEDVTVTLSYEMTEEEKTAIHFYAECVDEKGNAIAGYEKKTLRFSDSMDLTAEPFAIDEYEYVEAVIDGTVVLSVDKATVEDEDGKETIAYSYTTADGSIEVSEDTTVTLTYKSVKEAAEVTLTWNYVDEEGLAIEGAEGEPKFEDTLVLDDAEKAPVTIEGYEYVEATIDGVVITAITKTAEDADAEAMAEETADAEPVYSYAYTTAAGESVASEEDTETTLSYEETGIPVEVDATIVDEFGDEIDEKYTNMELPKFSDGELVLNDVENPPVAKVQVRKSLFKVIKYTYVQATIDNKIITGLKREATADTTDLKEKEQEFIYSYTTDGENWTKLKEDTTVYFEYTDGKKTTYTYEDAFVSVTATLQHANAIPDDAEFVVTAVTPSTSGYNYEAYMAALNANAAAISKDAVKDSDSEDGKAAFNEKNTLLYDIAFLAAPVDEEGNTIEGELVEYQPAEGSVNISISFKQKQLEEDLAAEKETDITVVHMPLSDSVKESVATTADATGISASDVNVEVVSDSTSITGEKIDFNLNNFSVVVVAVNGELTSNERLDKSNYTLEYILNGFNVLAFGNVDMSIHCMGAVMIQGTFSGSGSGYADSGNVNKPSYIGGKMTYGGPANSRNNKSDYSVFVGDDNRVSEDGKKVNDITYGKNATIYKNPNYVDMDGLYNNVVATSKSMAAQSTKTVVAGWDWSEIDIEAGSNIVLSSVGTKYIKAKINGGNAGAATIINVMDAGTVYVPQAVGFSTTEDGDNMSIVWNFPNASNVIIPSSLTPSYGHIIAPNATITVEGGNYNGCLVGQNMTINAEGHLWPYKGGSLVKPTSSQFGVLKHVNGATPQSDENFEFVLEELKNGAWINLQTVSNNGEWVNFSNVVYSQASDKGTHWYRIYEKQTNREGYILSTIQYVVKADVTSEMNGNTEMYKAELTYYKVTGSDTTPIEQLELIVDNQINNDILTSITQNDAIIDNIKIDKGSLSVTKSVTGTTATEPFYFTVRDSSGNLVSRNGSTLFTINAGSTVTIDELPFGAYTIQETDASGNPVSYTPGTFPYQVSYSSENVEVSAAADGSATITNIFVEETSVRVDKVWNDNENHDGLRPSEIQVQLTPVTLNAENGWSYTWNNLEKKDAQGNTITYAVDEVSVPAGYSKSVSNDGTHYIITNTHENEKVKAKVIKVWNDKNNRDGKRQDIEVTLKKNDTDELQTVTLTAGNNWTATVDNLDKYTNGTKNTYNWVEKTDPASFGYQLESVQTEENTEGFVTTITNSHETEKTNATVIKDWKDEGDQDGIRPESIKVVLKKGTTTIQEVELNKNNGWTATVGNLDKYENGQLIEYTWEESTEGLPQGYTLESQSTQGTVTTISNRYTPKTVSAKVIKKWDDQNNQDGKRPQSLTVNLYKESDTEHPVQTVVLTEQNSWTAIVENLPKYEKGNEIQYFWSEETLPEGYSLSGTEEKTVISGTITTLKNSYTPGKTSASVKKVWEDKKNQDGIRPESITVKLVKTNDGIKTDVQEVTLNSTNNWETTITDLPEYTGGKENIYSWEEVQLPEGYTLAGNTTNGTLTTLTNEHTPTKVNVTVQKKWEDQNNQDGQRPQTLAIDLMKKTGTETDNVTTVYLNEGNNWTVTVSNLDEYADGKKIAYIWSEKNLPAGYTLKTTSTKEGTAEQGVITTLTNAHTPEKVRVTVKKVWDDENNQDGQRPAELKVDLMNGETLVQTVTLNENNDWTATVSDLDKYVNGQQIGYTWVEKDLPEGYSLSKIPETSAGTVEEGIITTLTNTHTPGKTSASVKKVWNDAGNQDGQRPESIEVKLMVTNNNVKSEVSNAGKIILNEDNKWSAIVKDLPEYTGGKKNIYSWEEVQLPEGYILTENSAEGTVTTLTNTHTPKLVNVAVKKDWSDQNDQDGKRPTDLTVELWKNNAKVIGTVTLNSGNGWTATIRNLPEYENGDKIIYSWVEKDLPVGYSLSEPVVTSTEAEGIITHSTMLTNNYTPGEVSAQVKKAWNDSGNQDGKRPEEVKVVLRNTKDSKYSLAFTLNADNGWTATAKDLPEYTAGVKNEYYWTEDTDGLPDGYSLTETKVEGILTTLTNSYIPKTVNVAVEKKWDDGNNQDGKRPHEITVVLNKNGEEFKRVVLNEANNWKAGFADLPQYTAGQPNTYEWVEAVEGLPADYTLTNSGTSAITENGVITNVTTLTNSYTPKLIDVSVHKAWIDSENQDGKRPAQLEVTLMKNGFATSQTVILNQDNGWTSGIQNLPKYENGSEIKYTWSEEDLPDGYTMTENKTEGTITTITNSYTPGEVSVQIIKDWEDNNNQDNIRPAEITVVLKNRINVFYAKEVTLKASENWSATFSGLPEYTQGAKNQYYWTEESLPAGYELAGTSTNGFVTTITNRHTPMKVSATVKKIWDDAENQDGIRPQAITVDLIKKNGTTSTVAGTVTLDQTNDWTATINNLDKFTAGVENEYTWSEHTEGWPEGYRLSSKVTEGSITTLTNSYTPKTVDVSVHKIWDDAENQDGKRPNSVNVVLKKTNDKGTEIVRTVILNEDNQWTCEITGLPEYTNQQKNTYTWTEDETGLPEGYTLTNIETVGNLTTITNSYTPGKVSATVEKKWSDGENQDGIRPEQLEVTLLKNGNEYRTVTLTKDNNWRVTIDGLDEFTNKQKNVYTWDEKNVPAGYELTGKVTEGTLTTITNTHTTEKTRVTVRKVWDDAENQDGMRPKQLKVSLLKNGTSIQTVVLTQDNSWTYTVTGLDKYSDSGTLVEYRWEENTTEFNGYTLTNTETDDGTTATGRITTLTNTHVPGKIKVSVEKRWDDAENQDGKRPTELKVDLKKNGTLYTTVTLNTDNGWKATVANLDEYEKGQLIKYTWEEHTGDLPHGYSLVNTTQSGDNEETGVLTTLTNKYEPGKVSVSGEKTWNDANNQDGKRPTSITINLLADGVKIDYRTVTAQDGWKWSFTGLDEYKNGNKITYTITEEPVAGYTSVVEGYNVKNTHIPDTVSIEGKKTWNDADNQDGIRPASITVTLLADLKPYETRTVTAADNWEWKFTNLPKYKNVEGKVSEIGYKIQEAVVVDVNDQTGTYTSTVDGFNIENTHIPETVNVSGTKTWNDNDNAAGNRPETIVIHLWADRKEINKTTVSSADGWKWSFNGLPKYTNGNLVNYEITEDVIEYYTPKITETADYTYTVENDYTPDVTSRKVTKIWNDMNDEDELRPDSISVQLLANGKAYGDPVILNSGNGWSYEWTDLPVKLGRKPADYTVKEIGTVTGYTTAYSADTFTITNTHDPKVYVEGKKTWNDNNDQDGIRPKEITVRLFADGVLMDSKKVTPTEDGTWSWRFDNLPKYKDINGTVTKIRYSVQEAAVEDKNGNTGTYTSEVTGFDITNTHITEKTDISGVKKWEDAGNQDGKRPSEVTVYLYADGIKTTKSAKATEATNWAFSFTGLDKYKDGKKIVYTVKEEPVAGYQAVYSSDTLTITNKYEPEKTSLNGTKVWEDNSNQDGKRPSSIIVHLYADGKDTGKQVKVTPTEATGNTWSYSFTGLDKYNAGKEIKYTVKEEITDTVAKTVYTSNVDGLTITNSYMPETTSIQGEKHWDDGNNQDHKRPQSITVKLLADGKVTKTSVITPDSNGFWKYSFTDLPVYANGQKITYTVEEVVPEGYTETYTATADGFDITNKYAPEKVNINGIKRWNDSDNQDGIRPKEITVRLYADGVDTDKSMTVTEATNWTYSFTDLDKYKDGKEIIYTVKEDTVAGYEAFVTGYNIENRHIPEKINVSGTKTWSDADNQDGLRPSKIVIRLYADGTEIRHKEVTASDNWSWTFTDLDKFKDGKEIEYTISEDAVAYYTSELTGYNVKNTHKPETVEIQGTKTWDDKDDQDGKRPESIIVTLYADGEVYDTRTVTEKSGWIYRFTNLPKYAEGQQGHEIIYTVREDVVEGYSTEYTEGSYDITNTYTPEETSRTVTKIWEDEENQDGIRPTSIMVQLMADQKPYGDPVELNEANNWTYTWIKLPVKEKKKEITYKVEEISKIEGYDTTYSDDTFIITNTHKPAEVFVEGTKTWDDNDNQDGLRPTSITINLLADGEQIDSMVVMPAADGTWSWRFDNLPKFKNVNGMVTKIQYSIEEIKVDGYESKKDYANDRFNLINTHKPETVDLSGSKTWNDNDNADGSRPASIKISLLADGAVVAEKTVTEADGWSWSFKDLPKYAAGKEIRYTVSEDVVDGYTTSYSEDGLSVINSYTPELTGRSVVKIWDDSNNADQIRPVSIQVQLFADGAAYGDVITLSDGNNWSYTWSDLPAKKNGQYISYAVQEITNVNGYTVSISESGTVFTIVNYHPVTPPPTPTPTPSDEPTPTPSTPGVTPPAPTPTPPTGEVLGARRGGAVLGARRGLDQAVLGKRRRPSTGDSAAMIIWVIALFGAMGGAAASIVGLKKKDDKK